MHQHDTRNFFDNALEVDGILRRYRKQLDPFSIFDIERIVEFDAVAVANIPVQLFDGPSRPSLKLNAENRSCPLNIYIYRTAI